MAIEDCNVLQGRHMGVTGSGVAPELAEKLAVSNRSLTANYGTGFYSDGVSHFGWSSRGLDSAMGSIALGIATNRRDLDREYDLRIAAEGVASAARDAIQADVDQNEADSDAAHSAATADRAAVRDEMAANETARDASVEAIRSALQADVNANEADADASFAAATADRTLVRTEFAAADTTLQSNIDTEKGRIDAILSASVADKDSFAEIVDLINSVDTANDSAFAGYVLSNDAAVAAVQADVDQNEADGDADRAAIRTEFAAADAVLTQGLADELSDRASEDLAYDNAAKAREDAIQADVDANEAAAATDRAAVRTEFAAADAVLSGRLDVVEGAESLSGSIAYAVKGEKTRAEAAEAGLDSRLDTLEGSGPGSLANVAAVALAARNAIQADVDQNEADSDASHSAATADRELIRTQMNGADSAATLDRASIRTEFGAADTTLQANIDAEKGRIDAILSASVADKDSFAEIVDLINSVDTTNDNAFAAYVLSNDAAVAAVQADVDQNEADADASFTAASTDRAAVRSEFAAADSVISANLTSEVSRATVAEGLLEGRLDAYDSRIASNAVIVSTTGRLELSAGSGEPRMVMTKLASGAIDVCFEVG